MRRLLLFFLILQFAQCSCPSGFELRNGECIGLYATMSVAWKDATDLAIAKCNEIQGKPVIIHNAEDQEYWLSKFDPSANLIFGLMCNTSSKRWYWADGTDLDYKPPSYYNFLDNSCGSGYSWYMQANGFWDEFGTAIVMTVNIFCTSHPNPLVPSPDDCESFEYDENDGVCYQIGAIAENWNDAQMICKSFGANLASIHNQQENDFIRRLAVSRGAVNGVFLGGTISGKGKDFGWIDGSTWDFENYHSGFPITGSGDCLVMDTSTSSGQWMNIPCSEKQPVACIRDQKALAEPACNNGATQEGIIITSPGFPYTSSLSCDFFLVVDAGKRVQVEIIILDANSCCDFLIINDGYIGGHVIANLTGEVRNVTYMSTDNTMKVSWMPNGGVNVMGMAMTYRGV